MAIAREEIFGPVLSIIPFDSEDEAIAIANDTPYGLANYVQSTDGEKRNRVAARLRSGMVEMNGQPRGAGSPFGGIKASGRAREGGVWGIEEFLEVKAVSGWAHSLKTARRCMHQQDSSRRQEMSKALSGVRVLDLSRVLAGPWASQTLADLGAEVIKIERPGSGDDTRGWGPPYLKDVDGATHGRSRLLSRRQSRQEVRHAEHRACARVRPSSASLLQQADVFIENYKVGDMARYGLSYEDLRELNPRLIYCSMTGFGQTGPLAEMAGYDFIVQGMGGLMSITGERDDLPGGGPQKVGVAFADIMTGMYSTVAILAAIAQRENTGEGQYIDMALLDVQVATMANMNLNYLVSGTTPRRQGNAHANIVPYQVFDAKDGQMVIAVGNDSQFAKFCETR